MVVLGHLRYQVVVSLVAIRLSTVLRQMVVVAVVATTERTPSQLQGVRVVEVVTSNPRLSNKVLRVRLDRDTLEVMEMGLRLISTTQVEVVERVGLVVMLVLGSVVQEGQVYRHLLMAQPNCMRGAVVELVTMGVLLLVAQAVRVLVEMAAQATQDHKAVQELQIEVAVVAVVAMLLVAV
jgi:hypothetical protein